MALLTPLPEAAARALLDEYGLALERVEPLPAHGTVNSNFRVRASGANFFLRINEGKSDGDAAAEVALVERLRAAGVPTPEILRTRDGRSLARAAGKPVTLFPWLDGREAQPRAGDPSSVAVVGRALALLHAVGDPGELPRDHYSLDELERRLATFAHDPRFAAAVPRFAAELAHARKRGALPSGVIHQDLFPDNLLTNENGELIAILDFEQATRGRFVYDLAVAINAWCWDGEKISRAAMDAVLAAYSPLRPLSAAERATLPDELRLAAARFAITRVTDVALRANVDPELAARKNWRDYLARLDFWLATAS